VSGEDAGKTYDYFITQAKYYNRTGVMSKATLAPVIAALLKTSQISPPPPDADRFFDNSFVDRANAQLHH
jgi:hypothetical protein